MEFQNLIIKCYIEFRSIFVIWTISTSDSTSRREIGVFLKSRNIWFNASPCFPPAKWGSSATCALVILGEVLRSSLSQMAVYSQLSERASRAAIMNCPAFFCCKRGTLVMIKIAIPTAIRQANCLRNCDIAAGGRLENLLCVLTSAPHRPQRWRTRRVLYSTATLRLYQFMQNWQRFVFFSHKKYKSVGFALT